MIRNITIDPSGYERVTWSLTDPYDQGIVIKDIDGLGPVKGEISAEYLSTGGSYLKGTRENRRNVVLTLVPIGDDIEEIRHKIYSYFPIAQQVTLYIETDRRSVKQDFYVEHCDTDIFSNQVEIQVSLISMSSYWSAMSGIREIVSGRSASEPLFEFPFKSDSPPPDLIMGDIGWTRSKRILNPGDITTGLLITMTFNGDVKNLRIANSAANEQMRFFKDSPFLATERLIIDSRFGRKSITHVNAQNLYSAAMGIQTWDSSWMYVHPGANTFLIEYQNARGGATRDDLVEMVVEYEPLYRGV